MPTREEERRLAEQEAAAMAAQRQAQQAPRAGQPQPAEAPDVTPTEATRKFTETVPGGKYLVSGTEVDAHGNPIKEESKPSG